MNLDVTAALKLAEKLRSTEPRLPRLSFRERQFAGAILETVAKQAAREPSTPIHKESAWEVVVITLEVYLEKSDKPGGVL